MDPRGGGCPSSRQASSPAFLQGLLSPGTLGVDSPEVCRMASVSIRYRSGMQASSWACPEVWYSRFIILWLGAVPRMLEASFALDSALGLVVLGRWPSKLKG